MRYAATGVVEAGRTLGGRRVEPAGEMWLSPWIGLFQLFGHPDVNLEIRRAR
ncbi:hypothetical protein [Streptomyces brasiliensis]|uniref:Uncharacterized protein n=1 Tax=Streptomyces brasiliensis TaxID=1954 RepID=A0A917L410_9ACTN|nr:hypothetical protein [Streptomyces brasiliensis]GGJ39591.1 hypothetical protein GCM10010121_058360 [Streptomyces brasiliensis]